MVHRTRLRLLFLGFPIVLIGAGWLAHALRAPEGLISIALFGIALAYFIFLMIKMRCPRCKAWPYPEPYFWPFPLMRFPTHCDTCNLDFTRPRSRPQV
jgi:hypothetical protein